jgi:hypothetical protein
MQWRLDTASSATQIVAWGDRPIVIGVSPTGTVCTDPSEAETTTSE